MINKSITKAFVFIVNEKKGEYDRYLLPNDAENTREGQLSTIKYKSFISNESGYMALVIDADEKKNIVKQALNEIGENKLDDQTYLIKRKAKIFKPIDDLFLNNGLNIIFDQIKEKYNINFPYLDLTLFIHWGGGSFNSIEYFEQKLSEYFKFDERCEQWSIYSISSLRNSIFNVDLEKIQVPNLQGLIELKNRLSILSKLDDRFVLFPTICSIFEEKIDLEFNEKNENKLKEFEDLIKSIDVLDAEKLKEFKDLINYILDTCNFDWLKGKQEEEFKNELNSFPFSDDSDKEKRKRRLENFALILSKIDKEFN